MDTNVLLDVLVPGAPHAEASEHALNESLQAGALIVSEAVYAELAAGFPSRQALDQFLEDTGIRSQLSGSAALYLAGKAWQGYVRRRSDSLTCPSCGNAQDVRCAQCGTRLHPRQHLLADFLIGSHATVHADRLLTRDRGYYQTYFADLRLA